MNGRGHCKNGFALHWRSIVAVIVLFAVLVPVFCLSSDISKTSKWLCVVLIMTIFWLTEALPHSITSLIPIGLFPLLGVMNTVDTCKLYVNETVFTFLGSLIIASSIEACNLHKRIALIVLCRVKCYHRRLHFVMMAITMFISMWIQNFIVVAMMSTVCLSILEQLEVQGTTTLVKPKQIEDADEVLRPTRIAMGYLMGITYAATLGGCGSLLGNQTNLSLVGIVKAYSNFEIDYLHFFHYCAPLMLLNTTLTWLWLQFLFMGLLRPKSDDAVALKVTEEGAKVAKENIIYNYRAMGRLSAMEVQVAVMLVLFHLVLSFRSHHFVRKWEALSVLQIGDASPTIIFVILLFIIPSKWNCSKCCRKSAGDNVRGETNCEFESKTLLTWSVVRRRVPWGSIFLLGAGIALAESGRQLEIHKVFEKLPKEDIPSMVILLIVCLGCQIFTEFLSNAPAANIILPFLAAFFHVSDTNNVELMLPAALCLSMSFHTPIGSPGNSYVADLINMHTKDMLYCGIGPSIITLLTYWSTYPTSYGTYIFHKELKNATD